MFQFSANSGVKTMCTNLFAKMFVSCIDLQIVIRIIKKTRLFEMHYPTTNIQTEFKINWPIKNKINATMTYFP